MEAAPKTGQPRLAGQDPAPSVARPATQATEAQHQEATPRSRHRIKQERKQGEKEAELERFRAARLARQQEIDLHREERAKSRAADHAHPRKAMLEAERSEIAANAAEQKAGANSVQCTDVAQAALQSDTTGRQLANKGRGIREPHGDERRRKLSRAQTSCSQSSRGLTWHRQRRNRDARHRHASGSRHPEGKCQPAPRAPRHHHQAERWLVLTDYAAVRTNLQSPERNRPEARHQSSHSPTLPSAKRPATSPHSGRLQHPR